MRNLWVTRDSPIAGWVADLTPLRDQPQALADWLDKVLAAGEAREIFKVREAPRADYTWAGNDPIAPYLKRRFNETAAVDLFHFSGPQAATIGDSSLKVLARMAYYDTGGQLTETDVDDLGLLLRRIRPTDFEANWGFFYLCRPLLIAGPKIDFGDPQQTIWADRPGDVLIRFRIFSDIWFPWVLGFLEESFDVNRMYDNRVLAQRHTVRLNDFLTFVSESTTAIGGTWELDEEDSRTVSRFMLTANGIRFDVEPPGGIMEYRE